MVSADTTSKMWKNMKYIGEAHEIIHIRPHETFPILHPMAGLISTTSGVSREADVWVLERIMNSGPDKNRRKYMVQGAISHSHTWSSYLR